MVLDNLGKSLKVALKKVANAGRVDSKLIEELVRDIQRALLQADVNVKLVLKLTNKIKERALIEKPPAGTSSREHTLRIVYQEIINIIGKSVEIPLEPQKIMLVGLQGSGKTTTTAKLARYFQRKGLHTAVICADNFRPGAREQLQQLCEEAGVPFYGEEEKNAVKIVKNGLKKSSRAEVILVDTSGRHALEKELIKEMEDINKTLKPEQRLLVLDAAIGQQASEQSRAFNDSIGITGIIITKLDGTAKGGGALSAVSETDTGIAFIGVGERSDALEKFDPDRFISKLLGMGDLKALAEKAQEALSEEEFDPEAMLRGKFTLRDMYKQLEATRKMGPLKQLVQMMPMGGHEIDDNMFELTDEKLRRFKYIMDSMTEEELDNPKVIHGSRISRIARGSGCGNDEVKSLLKYHRTMQQALKKMKGGKFNMQKIMKRMNI